MKSSQSLTIIGRAERILISGHVGCFSVPAKVDTGADISSIWASAISEEAGVLKFVLFDKDSEYYNGAVITLPSPEYKLTRVANSFGHREMRFTVKLRIEVLGRTIRTRFTLADRSQKVYPILLGRRLLKSKFLVYVSQGEPLHEQEKAKRKALRIALSRNEG